MLKIGNAQCPVCGSVSHEVLARYRACEAAAHFCTASRNLERNQRLYRCIARLWGGDDAYFLRCESCGFGYGFPFVGGDEEFYSILHEQRGYPRQRWEFDFATKYVASKSFDLAPKVLDVGAGDGSFLKMLPPHWQRFAVEGSPNTRQLLETSEISVFRDLETAAAGNRFSLITMFQVLEHLANFEDVLMSCRIMVQQEGVLIISVPDCDVMIAQERATGVADMPPNHINKWTPQSLGIALRKSGFSVECVQKEKPSVNTLRSALHLKMLAMARTPGLAAWIYRLNSRSARILLLTLVAILTVPWMITHVSYLTRGGSFLVVARPQ